MAKIKQIKQYDYILDCDKDEVNPSIFKLTDLNPNKAADVYDILFEDGTFSLSFRALVKAAELGLIGWENVLDEDDKQVDFKIHTIKLLPINMLTEIGLEILKSTFPEFAEVFKAEEDGETPDPLA